MLLLSSGLKSKPSKKPEGYRQQTALYSRRTEFFLDVVCSHDYLWEGKAAGM
jgi:hypothetical protein